MFNNSIQLKLNCIEISQNKNIFNHLLGESVLQSGSHIIKLSKQTLTDFSKWFLLVLYARCHGLLI